MKKTKTFNVVFYNGGYKEMHALAESYAKEKGYSVESFVDGGAYIAGCHIANFLVRHIEVDEIKKAKVTISFE